MKRTQDFLQTKNRATTESMRPVKPADTDTLMTRGDKNSNLRNIKENPQKNKNKRLQRQERDVSQMLEFSNKKIGNLQSDDELTISEDRFNRYSLENNVSVGFLQENVLKRVAGRDYMQERVAKEYDQKRLSFKNQMKQALYLGDFNDEDQINQMQMNLKVSRTTKEDPKANFFETLKYSFKQVNEMKYLSLEDQIAGIEFRKVLQMIEAMSTAQYCETIQNYVYTYCQANQTINISSNWVQFDLYQEKQNYFSQMLYEFEKQSTRNSFMNMLKLIEEDDSQLKIVSNMIIVIGFAQAWMEEHASQNICRYLTQVTNFSSTLNLRNTKLVKKYKEAFQKFIKQQIKEHNKMHSKVVQKKVAPKRPKSVYVPNSQSSYSHVALKRGRPNSHKGIQNQRDSINVNQTRRNNCCEKQNKLIMELKEENTAMKLKSQAEIAQLKKSSELEIAKIIEQVKIEKSSNDAKLADFKCLYDKKILQLQTIVDKLKQEQSEEQDRKQKLMELLCLGKSIMTYQESVLGAQVQENHTLAIKKEDNQEKDHQEEPEDEDHQIPGSRKKNIIFIC